MATEAVKSEAAPKENKTTHSNRGRLLARLEELTELPLIVLAIIMIPLLFGPMLWDLSETEEETFFYLDTFIWGIFAVDLFVKLAIAPNRLRYLRSHWIDVLVVAVPFVRPLRILRIVVYGTRAFVGLRRMVRVDYLLIYAMIIVVIGATIATSVEQGAEGSNIHSFQDSLWWAFTTITTVGYGDKFPVTAAGRAVGVMLMLGGIAIFSALTANVAALLVRPGKKDNEHNEAGNEELLGEMRRLRQEISALREKKG
jgi:voltage-gated potassium channel